MRTLFKERKLFKGGNYMRKYGNRNFDKDLALSANKIKSCEELNSSSNSTHHFGRN